MNIWIVKHRADGRSSKQRPLLFWLPFTLMLLLLALSCGGSRGDGGPSERDLETSLTRSMKGMSIESLSVKDNVSVLTTTGGLFRIDLKTGVIEIRQRIGKERLLAKAVLDKDWLKTFSAPTQDGFDCIWEGTSPKDPKMIISGDSVIRFSNIEELEIRLEFSPIYCKVTDSNGGLLALDNTGGLAIMPLESSSNENWPKTFENNLWKLAADEPFPLVFIGVCPPRPFDWESSFLPVVHYSSHIQRYPTDEQIIAYSKYAEVLEMHSWVWQNRYDENARDEKGEKLPLWWDYSFVAQNYEWIPDDEVELRRVVETAHAHGMKVIPYYSFWREDPETPVNQVFDRQMAEIRRLKDTYDFDGLYVDGLSCHLKDLELSYKAARTLRELFGEDGWLTYHNTHTTDNHYPFINAYMDLIITSEHESFNRWTSTSYNISNAIASVWPEIPVDVEDGRPFLKELVDDNLLHNNRVILMTGKDGQWRMWRLYFTPDEMEFMQQYYFEALEKMKEIGYEQFISEMGEGL